MKAFIWQGVLLLAVTLIAGLMIHQISVNVAARSIPVGFGFLASYWPALLSGLLNTLIVSGLGIILATAIGVSTGIARTAENLLLRLAALLYVESIRNTPLLLQLFVWYGAVFAAAPLPHAAWHPLPGVFICNRGIILPGLTVDPGSAWPHLRFDLPVLGRFNFAGGITLPPELMALLAGLSIYTAAYIAEIVRGGIAAVDPGQREAAAALGLSRHDALRAVIWPQALRLILPPLIGQYLNLVKNSSLALAIGFEDIVAQANTMMNVTGQAVEGIALIVAVFLAINLSVSMAMARVNRHFAMLGSPL